MKRLILLAAALCLTTSDYALAQDEAPMTPPAFDENADGLDDGRVNRHRSGGRSFRGARGPAAGLDLTEEQREAIKTTVDALRADGAEREDIKAAVDAQLSGFGIDIEAIRAEHETAREAQHAEHDAVRALVNQLKEDGATREEIQAALAAQGFEPPLRGARGRGQGHRGARGDANGFGPRGGGPTDAPAPESAE